MFLQIFTILSNQTKEITMNTEFVASVVITGLVVVFVGLLLLVAFVSAFGKFFNRTKKPNTKQVNKQSSIVLEKKSTPQPEIENGISDEVIAVITAAVATISSSASDGKTFSIKSIKQAKPLRNSWANAGLVDNTRPF